MLHISPSYAVVALIFSGYNLQIQFNEVIKKKWHLSLHILLLKLQIYDSNLAVDFYSNFCEHSSIFSLFQRRDYSRGDSNILHICLHLLLWLVLLCLRDHAPVHLPLLLYSKSSNRGNIAEMEVIYKI